MYASTSSLPDLQTLTTGLRSVLGTGSASDSRVSVLERRPNVHASSLPSEFVSCRLADGKELRLFCKYMAEDFNSGHGHRGDVAYEAEVYRQLLGPIKGVTPEFYGAYTDRTDGRTWLIIEALEGAERITEAVDPESAMIQAAYWIGRFHAATEARQQTASASFLIIHDADYYLGWIRRTSLYAGHLHRQYRWLAELCERGEELIAPLLRPPLVVIHSELYPHNVLGRDGTAYLIDWQSAAMATGEIDLATLTEKWPADVVQKCKDAYRQGRWPHGEPSDFEQRLEVARTYLLFRWLGDRPEWTTSARSEWGFQQLHSLAEKLDIS